MAASILGAIAAIIGLGMLFTIVIPIDTVALLFPYRLAPQLILAAQIACAGALVTTAQADRVSLPRTLLLWTILAVLLYGSGIRSLYGLSCIYSAVAVLFAGRLGEERSIPAWLLGAVVAGLLAILTWAGAGWSGAGCAGIFLAAGLARRATNGPASAHPVPSRLPSASAVALPLLIGACLMQIGAARKDFLGPPPPADEQILYTWCQARTNRDDVFITPPALSSFRLGAERAIVIDSRCIAILPSEILEWYHRLVDECGTEFDSLSAADAAYRTLDVDRARRVAARYGAQYLVTERAQHRGDLTDLRQVYANPTFAVYALTPVTPEAAQGSYPRTMFLSTIARMPPLR